MKVQQENQTEIKMIDEDQPKMIDPKGIYPYAFLSIAGANVSVYTGAIKAANDYEAKGKIIEMASECNPEAKDLGASARKPRESLARAHKLSSDNLKSTFTRSLSARKVDKA